MCIGSGVQFVRRTRGGGHVHSKPYFRLSLAVSEGLDGDDKEAYGTRVPAVAFVADAVIVARAPPLVTADIAVCRSTGSNGITRWGCELSFRAVVVVPQVTCWYAPPL